MPNTRNNDLDEIISKKLGNLATKQGIEELKILINGLHNRIEAQNNEIISLKEKVSSQDTEISQLKDRLGVLSASVEAIKKDSDANEQYSRRYCLRINGIKKDHDESGKDCINKVLKVCEKFNVSVKENDIDRAHRVGREKKTMIVKFYSFEKRTSLYKARKQEKNIKIHLDITRKRLSLLDAAKKLLSDNCGIDFVFADINCNTVAKMTNGDYKFFDNLEKLKSFL